jgi:hypothetical protein
MISTDTPDVGLERYGPIEIRRELESTNALLTAINQEVWASAADVLFKTKWRDLYRDWLEFYQGKLGLTGVISNLRDATFDRAAAYRREALKFRYALIKATSSSDATAPGASAQRAGAPGRGGLRLPDVHLPNLTLPELPSFPWRALVYGGVAVVGGILLVRIVRPRRRS